MLVAVNKKAGSVEFDGLVAATPFLKKTFEMVEDPNTDPIVSWSEMGHSFVVWDSHKFSETLLPKYFKHSNFSSFIRQLNTYGFRKVDSHHRWEFANEGFQGGKKHLLRNITSRRRSNKCNKHLEAAMKNTVLKGEVEQLKKDQSMLDLEILKLTLKHEESQVQLTNVEEQVKCAELKQFQMLVFLTRMARRPSFVEQLIHMVKQEGELDGACMLKRCKLDTTSESGFDCRHQGDELLAKLQSEQTGLLSETVSTSSSTLKDDSCSSIQGLRSIGYDVSCTYDDVSKQLMGESSVVGEEVNMIDSNIYLELEDLISKSANWVGSTSGLMGQKS
ncbi:hypothetical protein RJT34_14921 [Clitoria ternatea]|uniref:HSF-type DNA-binding domain-containing protein n=1 Tax=Clitoria ternatea TaxID=43366 RepID=A0AAN9JR90_CLITE